MSDKRTSFKNHVRAAKEWLGEAESSLDKEQDLRGDLKLMLAQAELQRANETKHLTKRELWLRRIIPLLCAVLLVAVIWQMVLFMTPQPAAVPAEPQQPVIQVVREIPVIEKQESAAPEVKAVDEVPADEPTETLSAQDVPVSGETSESAVPSRDMQKLMNTAGQSLRAQ